jgi:hypothetical protein
MKVLCIFTSTAGVLAFAGNPASAQPGENVTDTNDFLLSNANTNLFGGDIETEFHQVRDAFGQSSAQRALDDAVITYDESLDQPGTQGGRRLGAANLDGVTLWQGGVMSFSINPSYGTDVGDTRLIEDAMREIATKTGIKFRAHLGATETKYLSSVDIVDGKSCSSFVGDVKAGKREVQELTLKGATATDKTTCR